MCFNKIVPLLILILSLTLSCGLDEKRLSLSGTVDISGAAVHSGPVFVALARGHDIEEVLADPLNSIEEILAIDKTSLAFNIDLSSSSLNPGDEIILLSFVDNNYAHGVPFPDNGDYVGVYMNRDTFSPFFTLHEGTNSGINLNVCRAVYSYDARVSGSIVGDTTGAVTVIAYAGEITSLDLGSLDHDAIIGYQELAKGTGPASFSFSILPYGFPLPVQNVYLIAYIDTNANGIPDGGDRLGFYSSTPGGLPSVITLNEGDNPGYSIVPSMSMPYPSASPVSIKGFFQRPSGYDPLSPPVFLIVTDTVNMALLFTEPLSAIKAFYRFPPGEYTFDLDLSSSGLSPGNDVMIMALWDRDYTSGFPDPTPNDKVGFFQNNSELSNRITLSEGENLIEPFGDWNFDLNRLIYEHNASISFQMDNGSLPSECYLKTGDQVLAIAVHKDGCSGSTINNMNYIVATSTITIDDPDGWYSVPVLPAVYETISVSDPFAISDLYLFAVLDANKNGRPDEGEYIGYYWEWIIIYFPKTFSISDGITTLNRSVRFTSNTF